MGDSLYFYIFVSFFCIFVFYHLLSQGGAVGDGQKGDSKVFCRLSRENLIQSRLYCFFFMISCWLWYLHGLILYTNIHVIYLINHYQFWGGRRNLTLVILSRQKGFVSVSAFPNCLHSIPAAKCTFKSAKKQAIELHQPPALLTKSNPDSG